MSYSEKLKNSRWQKKRLEIFSRDNFTCQICMSSEKTLHVHHKNYVWDRDPWDYPDTNFITYCEACHQLEEYYKDTINQVIYDLRLMGYSNMDISKHLEQLAQNFINNGKQVS